jgi:hypothetical protein
MIDPLDEANVSVRALSWRLIPFAVLLSSERQLPEQRVGTVAAVKMIYTGSPK